MWKCPMCSEQIEDNFDACWKCGTTKDGEKLAHFDDEIKGQYSTLQSGHFHFALIGHYHFAVTS